jgi:hypothetical protein
MTRLYGIIRCLFRPCAWVEHSRRIPAVRIGDRWEAQC